MQYNLILWISSAVCFVELANYATIKFILRMMIFMIDIFIYGEVILLSKDSITLNPIEYQATDKIEKFLPNW